MIFDSYGKSYGGYSTHSLPTRNAESKKKKKKKRKKDPKYVHDKYEEILKGQKKKDKGLAKALSWSIFCKYKKPGHPSCKKEPDEYFANRKAYANFEEQRKAQMITRRVGALLDQLTSKGILKVYDIVEDNASSKYVSDLALYMWTRGEVPPNLLQYGKEALILGEIANNIHRESKPSKTPTKSERREAVRLLMSAFEHIYRVWSIDVWARTSTISKHIDLVTLKLEILSYDNRIKHAYEYNKLLSLLLME